MFRFPSSLITIPHTLPATKGDDDGGHAPLNRLTAPRQSQWLGIKCAPPAINNLLASDLFPSVSETLRRHPTPIAYKIALLPSFSLPMPISVPIPYPPPALIPKLQWQYIIIIYARAAVAVVMAGSINNNTSSLRNWEERICFFFSLAHWTRLRANAHTANPRGWSKNGVGFFYQ